MAGGDEETPDVEDQDHTDDPSVRPAAKHDSVRTADLEKVTDYVEEEEMMSQNISDVCYKQLTPSLSTILSHY